jgi:hypothetical protein
MADYRELYAGKFLTGPECAEQPTFKITAVREEQVEDPEKPKQFRVKVVIYGLFLRDRERPWIVCKSSAIMLAALFGEDHTRWVGRKVTLRFDPEISVDGRKVGGARPLGSPELEKPITVSIKLPRRKATRHELVPTGDPLPLALAALQASKAALAGALATLPKPTTIPTEPDRRARLAAKLLSGWPGVSDVIRGTAPGPATTDHQEAPAADGGEE